MRYCGALGALLARFETTKDDVTAVSRDSVTGRGGGKGGEGEQRRMGVREGRGSRRGREPRRREEGVVGEDEGELREGGREEG